MPLDQLLRRMWRSRLPIVVVALLVFVVGATIIQLLPRRYLAQAVIAPAETTGIATSTLLSPTPMLGGGLLESRQTGHFAVYLDVLRSPEAVALLVWDTGLLAHLTGLRGSGPGGALRRLFDLRIEADADDAQRWVERNLAITPGIGTVTVTLSLAHQDRDAALDALQRLHAMAEAKVRADLAELTRRRIAAIEARLAVETDLFLRTMLYDQLGQHQRSGLIIGVDEVVAARLVSRPMVELRPSLPNRPLLLLLLAVAAPMLALFGAACLVLLGGAEPRRRQAELPFGFGGHRGGAD